MKPKIPARSLTFTNRSVLIGVLATTLAATGTWIVLEVSNDVPQFTAELPSSAGETIVALAPVRYEATAPIKPSSQFETDPESSIPSPMLAVTGRQASLASSYSSVQIRADIARTKPPHADSSSREDQDQSAHSPQAVAARPAHGPIILEVSPGVRLPAVLMESDEVLSPQAATIKDRIAEEFASELGDAADPAKSEDPNKPEITPETYERAVRRADEIYRMFFGDTAYNQRTMQAAKQAVREKNK